MYSTKRLHKNHGAVYISLNDPYKGDKAPAPERWKGKRLSCPAYPAGDGFFTPFTYASEPYVGEAAKYYVATQPLEERKSGFGSRDASKRDEFAYTLTQEAYRETLRKEAKLTNKNKQRGSKAAESQPPVSSAAAPRPRSFLYDIGRGRTTAFNPKLRRDTYYAPPAHQQQQQQQQPGEQQQDRVSGRRLGPHRLTSDDVGRGVWATEHAPPEFGPISCIKSFCDHSHIHATPY